ncbi:hypothetical protein [Peptostreptococcus equinus]|uniref:Uncharacterized protein n=1 Tax=Peptostreptococcus equinus TaxID=3003601 RepID=A0ABY7JPK3_9FIRM|nr:hypothetical protein [Peptostreptococcus sp. CBA3647]WAW14414.1 hypothetical protein O0R46_07365 [Peptostreptococcus sp. CBA3647]
MHNENSKVGIGNKKINHIKPIEDVISINPRPVSLICLDTRLESEVDIQDILISQRMTKNVNVNDFYRVNKIINCLGIDETREFSELDGNYNIMLALNDILNYGYLLGVRNERKKKAKKKAPIGVGAKNHIL